VGPNGRGAPVTPSAHPSLPRREFLALAGATALLAACGGGSSPTSEPAPRAVAYRLSTRGRRASGAAKAHAANKRFASRAAADAGRAHPGDRARVVAIDVSRARWDAWFGGGAEVIDLRHR